MTPTLESLAEEQQAIALRRFDYATAWQLGALMQAEAAAQHLPVAIEVTHGETVVFFSLLPGATPDNPDWTRRKRNVALRFHQSSLHMRLLCEKHGWEFAQRFRLPPDDYAASGGGVPLIVEGTGVVGAASVSGLPDVEDHALVAKALRQIRITQGA
ncbi:heme-degrading domain-containing protein [Devosia soli]|uniref:heme-degrading domain-containing protein n=1 Tax=Devosia soli TaxID=361041 RepID=UPI000A59FDBE|nr:heme-degrading domain-containing protein [Devosia soli]